MSDIYLFRNTLRDLVRPGKLTAAVLLVGLAVLFGILARANVKPEEFSAAETYNGISARLVFGFIRHLLTCADPLAEIKPTDLENSGNFNLFEDCEPA